MRRKRPVELPEILLCEAGLPDGAEDDGLGLGVQRLDGLADADEAHAVLGAEALLLKERKCKSALTTVYESILRLKSVSKPFRGD